MESIALLRSTYDSSLDYILGGGKMSDQQVANVDEFYQMKPERVYLNISNCGEDGNLKVILEVNGIERVLFNMPGRYTDPSNGLIASSHSLTWLLKNQKLDDAIGEKK